MAETSIGIKIADGSFYPVLQEGAPGRKRVILTTAKDNQTGAQIDLYRGNGTGISGATYIGTLLIDEIEPAPQGNPEIELIVKLDPNGNLDAQASDRVTGDHQTLSVALDFLSPGADLSMPDFDLDERYQPDLGVSPAEETRLTSETVAPGFPDVELDLSRHRRRRTLQYIAIALIAAAVIVVVILVVALTRHAPAPSAQAATSSPAASAPSTTPEPIASSQGTPSAASTSSQGAATTPPANQQSAQPAQREGGVVYQLRWGDTLWDLSMSFYRTPWLYGKIAKANNIKNPNLIYAQTQIYIPER